MTKDEEERRRTLRIVAESTATGPVPTEIGFPYGVIKALCQEVLELRDEIIETADELDRLKARRGEH